MRKTEVRSEIQIYRMPRIADEPALARVAERVLRAGGNGSFKLEFDGTIHIDYRALGRLVQEVRRLGPVIRPIVLSGLDPYCEAIVHFTLRTKDWELFTQKVGGDKAGASLGRDTAGMRGSGSVLLPGRGGAGLFSEPCPN